MTNTNATYAEMSALLAQWQAAGSRGPWTEAQADRLIELLADLDRHLSQGGRPPAAWTRARCA